MTPGSPESLKQWLDWLYRRYPDPCICEHEWQHGGYDRGVDTGWHWFRVTSHPRCPHHGETAANYPFRTSRSAKSPAESEARSG
jgi:hypothetical protein